MNPPAPWYGGKRLAAPTIWAALGDVRIYLEPFAGMLGALLGRPAPWRGRELVNDLDGHVANFWRAAQQEGEGLEEMAQALPWHEVTHHAHAVVLRREEADVAARLRADPAWYDRTLAAWWYRQVRWTLGVPLQNGLAIPHIVRPCQGIQSMAALQARLRDVVVVCGDWQRLVTSCLLGKLPTPIGILLDPPYGGHAGVYGQGEVAEQVRAWAIAHGEDPRLRIVLCAYEGMGMPAPWRAAEWWEERKGGRGVATRPKEVLWLSQQCEDPAKRQLGLWG